MPLSVLSQFPFLKVLNAEVDGAGWIFDGVEVVEDYGPLTKGMKFDSINFENNEFVGGIPCVECFLKPTDIDPAIVFNLATGEVVE